MTPLIKEKQNSSQQSISYQELYEIIKQAKINKVENLKLMNNYEESQKTKCSLKSIQFFQKNIINCYGDFCNYTPNSYLMNINHMITKQYKDNYFQYFYCDEQTSTYKIQNQALSQIRLFKKNIYS
eukprot:TRINITY_DN23174_c0_g1_i1.p2 TRINITY_DN23174_c0_g1~~TRINITY_DN23174_c0_g1_i1.p2  ORF type:complete len:126 (-),score=18.29 TRINITY_DN23174_c0_g1_i1:110-487(-)